MKGYKKVRVKGVGMRCRHTTGKKKGKLAPNSRCGLGKKKTRKRR